MGGNRIILIWIGIFILIGLILLMVACETGILLPRNKQENVAEKLEITETTPVEPEVAPKKDVALSPEPEEDKPETITVGKAYSGNLADEGAINVLIIGEDKLNNLYDTIGIASIDKKNKKVKLIMIPRDTYIEYSQDIKSRLEEAGLLHTPGVYKINFAHHIGNMVGYSGKFDSGSISFLARVIEEKFRIELDDYVKINTKGFRELIDYLGGVDIYVPYNMDYDDPVQDLHIHIPKGMQHLDGATAEGFVRFRQGYREDGTFFEIGDTGRKKNQLNFLKELIKQKGTIGNIGKIPGIIGILGKNVQHSIGPGDVLKTYMGIASDVIREKYEIETVNIDSDKMIRIDGSSYLVLE